MKFVNTIAWALINVEEILKIDYEEVNDRLYSYFHLKNGDRHDVYDAVDSFNIHDEIEYWFDAQCHNEMNKIILKMILDMDEGDILDITAQDDWLWKLFLCWADANKEKLTARNRQKVKQ